jgi:hypothetical protein
MSGKRKVAIGVVVLALLIGALLVHGPERPGEVTLR